MADLPTNPGSGWRRYQTACLRGHPYIPANTYVDSRGPRRCRECDSNRGSGQARKRRRVEGMA